MLNRLHRTAGLVVLSSLCGLAAAHGGDVSAVEGPLKTSEIFPRYVVDEGMVPVTLYSTGEVVESPAFSVWKPACGTPAGAMSVADLEAIVAEHDRIVATGETHTINNSSHLRDGGFDVIFNVSGSVPSGADGAFALAEAYLEATFSDPITVTISVTFQNLGNGVLGATNSTSLLRTYSEVRSGLIADMDADDTIRALLPEGSTIPVRYNSNSDSVNNEASIIVTRPEINASIGSVGGGSGSMVYNTAFSWDFDPSNGVPSSRWSFVDVIVHETGHALGFVSEADNPSASDMTMLDLARFQRTDGTGDYNPDTAAEWTTAPRLVDYNSPNDQQILDLVDAEYRMSDGTPYQASHWRQQNPAIGNMEPALANGLTFFPDYFTDNAIATFDFIGYDFPADDFVPCLADINGDHILNNTDINSFVARFITNDLEADLNGDGAINNTDINLFVSLFIAGCN